MTEKQTPLAAAVADLMGQNPQDEKQEYQRAMALGAIFAYSQRWATEMERSIQSVKIETELYAPLVNPDTGKQSRLYHLGGKLDKVAKMNDGSVVLFDHKTSSESLEPDSDYWARLRIDPQILQYEALTGMNEGMQVDSVVWDVLRKPDIRAKKTVIGKAFTAVSCDEEEYRQMVNGTFAEMDHFSTYCGLKISAEESVDEPGEVETPQMYARRVAQKMSSDMDRYFARRVVTRSSDALLEYMKETWRTGRAIRDHEMGKLIPYKNTACCVRYGRSCQYLPLCAGYAEIGSADYVPREKRHSELARLPDDELKILTNSRMTCFKRCPTEHDYRYIKAIERRTEDTEAIYFGNMFHSALDAFWGKFNPEKEVSNE